MTDPVQLDLFGKVAAALAADRVRVRAAYEWVDRFERADWVAPWPLGDGRPAGTVIRGYRCPDPECGQVEPTAFTLSINHGFDPTVTGHAPYNGRCHNIRPARVKQDVSVDTDTIEATTAVQSKSHRKAK